MPRDPEKAKARKARYLERKKVEKHGAAAAGQDMRGRHGNHARGRSNGRWNGGQRRLTSHGYVAVLPTHTNQRWAGFTAVAKERIEFVGRVNFGQDDGSGVKNGNRGGTQVLYFRAFDLGFTRTVWLKTREIMGRWA